MIAPDNVVEKFLPLRVPIHLMIGCQFLWFRRKDNVKVARRR